ncbi:hypothetical protein EYC84_006522 [Monilinia fructicola]|uniref:Cytochrome P450 n=1 Tax=Monilinia fructicola TaxID=38448 RepID=A0A5M9K469_MONFR|nr:hypothetical protein EYC84_006522 [Monilinia fructicola]
MTKWYNWVTFDIFGDLCFGESFQCVEKVSHHPWVSTLFDSMKLASLTMATRRQPLLKTISKFFIPGSLLERVQAHNQLVTERSREEEKSIPITSSAAILIIAGSETTGTVLSGLTYRLLQNPEVLRRLVKMIRETFASEDQINIEGVSNLTYLLAVLHESMRIYPPHHSTSTNHWPDGDIVCGKWIPAKTTVAVNNWAAFRSARNFTDPDKFIPERFMGDSRYASDNFDAFQPFSLGPRRNCIGRHLAYAEMLLTITRILWNFDLELCDGMDKWDQQKIYLLWQKICRERCDVAADASRVWNQCKLRIVCSEMNLPRALDISPFLHLA